MSDGLKLFHNLSSLMMMPVRIHVCPTFHSFQLEVKKKGADIYCKSSGRRLAALSLCQRTRLYLTACEYSNSNHDCHGGSGTECSF